MRWEHLARVDEHDQPVEAAAWDDAAASRLAITIRGLKGRKGSGDDDQDTIPHRLVLPEFAIAALKEWRKVQPESPGSWL